MEAQFYGTTNSVTYKVADFAANKISILGIRLGNETDGNLINIEMTRLPSETEAAFWARAKAFISAAVLEALGCTMSFSTFSVSDDGTDSIALTDKTGHNQAGEKVFAGKIYLIIAKEGVAIDSFLFEPTLLDSGNVVSVDSYAAQQNALNLGFATAQ